MPKHPKLTSEERDLLRLVTKAIGSNPFSDERAEMDREMAGHDSQLSPMEIIEAARGTVAEALLELERRKASKITDYTGDDRGLIERAVLFDVFHRHIEDFDQLLLKQAETENESILVPFAGEVIDALLARGFTQEEADRYFAEFYQLRRGYFFIHVAASGLSPCMQDLRKQLWNNIFTRDVNLYDQFMWNRMEDFSTLLLGETGTGKGMAALAIGRSGFIPFDSKKKRFTHSFTDTFTSLNLSQFPESLIESELFGHRKGAFTGAIDDHQGAFSRCSPHGAIFLDEIGDVDIPIQIKLLQVLQDRTFSPVGSHQKKRFQGRVIAATNKSLLQLRREGKFRDDFYYRLCSDEITVPALRQRIQEEPREMEDLLERILKRLCGDAAGELKSFVMKSLDATLGDHYEWPGNVRELEQATRRILLKGRYEGDRGSTDTSMEERLISDIRSGEMSAKRLLHGYNTLLYERHGTYESVAERTGQDWRTVKKYVEQ